MIEIPQNALVVLCGPAGCGKSTFARKHFKPTEIVSSDECRARISDSETNQLVSHLAFDLMMKIIELRLSLGRLCVADSTALANDLRRKFRTTAAEHGAPAIVIAWNLPLETCKARNQMRERKVEDVVLERQWTRMRQVLKNIAREDWFAAHVIQAGEPPEIRFVTRKVLGADKP